MSNGLILIFSCAFLAVNFEPAAGVCSVSKYSEAFGNWVKCSNATVDEAMRKGGPVIAAITISQSRIYEVADNAFSKYAKALQALTMQNCGIGQLKPNALAGLTYLKKLNLANNNITVVRSSWFASLMSLEQLDLSFNSIREIDPGAFAKMTNIRRLNLDDNQLECLEPKDMEPMRSVAKIRVTENPLKLMCRARMTLWFNDKGINYSNGLDPISGSWLDRVLWLCAEDDYVQTITEERMRQCVLLNLFNQLRSALKSTDSYRGSSQQCATERRAFAGCIANKGGRGESVTNGEAATRIIVALRDTQKKLRLPAY